MFLHSILVVNGFVFDQDEFGTSAGRGVEALLCTYDFVEASAEEWRTKSIEDFGLALDGLELAGLLAAIEKRTNTSATEFNFAHFYVDYAFEMYDVDTYLIISPETNHQWIATRNYPSRMAYRAGFA